MTSSSAFQSAARMRRRYTATPMPTAVNTVPRNHSTIGANVFLTHSIPPHSLVISEDVRIRVMDKLARKSPALDFQI